MRRGQALHSHRDCAEPCGGCGHRALCATGLACARFVYFVETNNAHGARGERIPSRRLFARLFPEDAVKALRREWHDEGRALAVAAFTGKRPRMTRAEAGRRYRERMKIIWRLQPERREFHLARHRAEALRRSRARGRRTITPEIASARSRLAWQRRRERAAAAGLTMSADELLALRKRIGLTQRELGAMIEYRRAAVANWERGDHQAPPRAVERVRALVCKKVPTTV
jgi:DNA-binding transcriptional regulator YiaG